MTDTEVLGMQACDGCDKSDTDPMIHMALCSWDKDERTTVKEPSFHFDCLPQEFREDLSGPEYAVTLATIEAAESGTKGDALHAFIQDQHDDNQEN